MMPIPNISFYSAAQVAALRDAVIAERLRRVTGGTVVSGGRNGANFTMETATESELASLEQALSRRLKTRGPSKRRISFG